MRVFAPLSIEPGKNSENSEFNDPFSEWEFKMSLKASNTDSAPRIDGIKHGIIDKLPKSSQKGLLPIFNRMFMESSYPEKSKDTFVKFIPMGGGGYRPIFLTSCVAKFFERMFQIRLDYMAETNWWLPDYQFGFGARKIIKME